MIIYQNTDRQVDQKYTNYPFTQDSTCTINSQRMPAKVFYDMNITVQTAGLTVYISSIYKYNDTIYIRLTDSTKSLFRQAPLQLGQQILFFLDQIGDPKGISSCSSQLFSILNTLLSNEQNNRIVLGSNQFTIIPECITCFKTRGLNRITLNNTPLRNTTTIQLNNNISFTKKDQVVTISVYGDRPEEDGQCLKYINDVAVGNKHVRITHNTLSNLRVITDKAINLVGITDV